MNCSRFETLLSDYMDGVLDAPVEKAIEEHLHVCELCPELVEEVGRLRAELEAFPEAQPPEVLVHQILLSTTGLPKDRSLWRDLLLPTVRPFLTQRFAFATGVMFVFLSLVVNMLGPGFSTLSSSDLSSTSISEESARLASRLSHNWNQFKDARSRFFEELSLWTEDVSGRLDYHLVTNLFKSYQETVSEQEGKIVGPKPEQTDTPTAPMEPEDKQADQER